MKDDVEPIDVHPLTRSVRASKYTPGRSVARRAWLVALTALALLTTAGAFAQPYIARCFSTSKTEVIRLVVAKYADEAYPKFRVANPSRVCPVDLYELSPWMDKQDIRDPYGTPYAMICDHTMILVGSAGEDTQFNTADDVWGGR